MRVQGRNASRQGLGGFHSDGGGGPFFPATSADSTPTTFKANARIRV
jgi:hypothetical protein